MPNLTDAAGAARPTAAAGLSNLTATPGRRALLAAAAAGRPELTDADTQTELVAPVLDQYGQLRS